MKREESAVRKFKTSGADRNRTLLDFLTGVLSLSAADARQRICEGGVYLGKERVADPGRRLAPGTRLLVYPARETCLPSLALVHVDEDVVVVDKPSGLPSQAARDNAAFAADAMVWKDFPDARLFHRLDRDVIGLLLFTRTPVAHAAFRNRLRRGAFIRRYRARVSGHLVADAGIFDEPIGPDSRERTRQRAGVGKPARTHFKVLRRMALAGQAVSELELTLETGRTHQIRVHLAHAGHPVLGDARYGKAGPALFLAAWELEWPGQTVTSPLAHALFDSAPR